MAGRGGCYLGGGWGGVSRGQEPRAHLHLPCGPDGRQCRVQEAVQKTPRPGPPLGNMAWGGLRGS